jgi:DNA cross-link repair 1A protein
MDLTEVATEQDSVSESELLKDRKPDGGVEVVDLTEDRRKDLSLCAAPEQCMDDKGKGEAELLEAQEQNMSSHADLWEFCRHKVTTEGKNKIQVTKEISAVHVIIVSATIKEEATENDTTTPETGKSFDRVSERASDSSTSVGSSKGLNASLGRLYRSMNVSAPRPLPSLVELMGASKRPRVPQNCAAIGF